MTAASLAGCESPRSVLICFAAVAGRRFRSSAPTVLTAAGRGAGGLSAGRCRRGHGGEHRGRPGFLVGAVPDMAAVTGHGAESGAGVVRLCGIICRRARFPRPGRRFVL